VQLTRSLAQSGGRVVDRFPGGAVDNFGLALIQDPVDAVVMSLRRLKVENSPPLKVPTTK